MCLAGTQEPEESGSHRDLSCSGNLATAVVLDMYTGRPPQKTPNNILSNLVRIPEVPRRNKSRGAKTPLISSSAVYGTSAITLPKDVGTAMDGLEALRDRVEAPSHLG